MLGACALLVACADEPEPRHPAHAHHSKKHKKHTTDDSDEVVVSDDEPRHSKRDSDEANQDDEPKTKHSKRRDTDESKPDEAKHDDDEPRTKHSKRHDTDEANQDDEPRTKHSKRHDTDETKTNADESKPKHSKVHDTDEARADEAKADEAKHDDDEPKPKHSKLHDRGEAKADEAKADEAKADEAKADETKADDTKADKAKQDEDEAKPKKPTPRTSKRKPVVAHRAAKAKAVEEAVADNEIEMGGEDSDAEPSTNDANAGAAVASAAPPAPASPASPLAINDRVLVARHGTLEVHGGLRTTVLTLPTAMAGMTTTKTAEALALGATYGIGEKVEIGGDYTASLSPGAIKGPLTLHGAYFAVTGPKLDVAVAAALAVDFLDFVDAAGTTTSKATYGLQLGGWVRYRVTTRAALFTGLPALPAETVALSKQAIALPPLPYQLALGVSSGSAIALDLPVGVGYQATRSVYAFAMTDLAHLRISNTQTALLFADFIPVTLGGFYSRDTLDLGATFADDLKQGTGDLRFELVVRYAIP